MEIENEQNENNNQKQKIPFSLQGEIDLVNQEEEENKDGPTQKERLQKMLIKLNKETEKNNPEENAPQENPENPENENGEEPQRKVVLRGVKKVLGTVTPTKLNIKKQIPEPFDTTFNLENEYFYKEIESKEWDEITSFLENYISENKSDESELKSFFNLHPSIRKGKKGNAELFLSKINSLNIKNFSTYQTLMKFALGEYFQPKPVICECHFFPNPSNEEKVVSMLRTCKKTLDIAIFSLTLDSIAEAILEAFQRGIKVRMIADDECAKNKGSNVKLIASVGVPCKLIMPYIICIINLLSWMKVLLLWEASIGLDRRLNIIKKISFFMRIKISLVNMHKNLKDYGIVLRLLLIRKKRLKQWKMKREKKSKKRKKKKQKKKKKKRLKQ